ncbi:MAG: AI-2E family transporter [Christensenellaceae bacterium]|nr:AI-2E family transporter [Christensenellaceae bacterium]
MNKLRAHWRETSKYLFVIIAAILFYELMENFAIVVGAFMILTRVLTPIICGLIIAYLVNIPTTLIQKLFFKKESLRNKKYVRSICLTMGYVLLLGAITLLFCLVIPKVIDSIKMLFENFDGYYKSIVQWATNFWESLNLNEETTKRAVEISNTFLKKLEQLTYDLVPKLLNYTFNIVGFVADMLLSLAFSIYVLADKERLLARTRRLTRAIFSERISERILDTFSFANKTFRGYISGQLTSCIIIGILCYIGMRVLGMPFPEMISVFIAVFALIPILGPWLSTIPSAFIILMASPEHPMLAVWFIVMVIAIQQIDDNFIYPRVVGDAVGLSSAWVLAAIIIGGGLLGLKGLLFAVPTMAVLYRIVGDLTNARARAKGVPLVDTVPEADYDFRGHRKNRKKVHSKSLRKDNAPNEPGIEKQDADKSSGSSESGVEKPNTDKSSGSSDDGGNDPKP